MASWRGHHSIGGPVVATFTGRGVYSRPMNPPLSIVVPTLNRRALLLRLLDRLANQAGKGSFEVVVADNISEDGTKAAVTSREWPFPIAVVDVPERTRASARNRGAAAATGEILLFLDDDMEPRPGMVAAHLEASRANPGTVFVGRPEPHPGITPTLANRYLLRRWERILRRMEAQAEALPWGLLLTGHFSIPARIFVEAGRFDETFKVYSFEDSEFGMRLVKAGVPIRYLPEAVSWHDFDETMGSLVRKTADEGASARVFAALHPEVAGALGLHSLDSEKGSPVKRLAKRLLFTGPVRWALGLLIRAGDGMVPDARLLRLIDFWLLSHRARGAGSSPNVSRYVD